MLSQVTGAAMAAVLVLGYVLLVQCLTAACVLLCEFIVLRVRALWGAVGIERSPQAGKVTPLPDDQGEPYRIGGGLLKW
jgi:hypothetical protein